MPMAAAPARPMGAASSTSPSISAAAAAMAGPLVLLRYRRFNDVLDGATFGVTAAVAWTGAQAIVGSLALFASGLRPGGADAVPWVARILALGVNFAAGLAR